LPHILSGTAESLFVILAPLNNNQQTLCLNSTKEEGRRTVVLTRSNVITDPSATFPILSPFVFGSGTNIIIERAVFAEVVVINLAQAFVLPPPNIKEKTCFLHLSCREISSLVSGHHPLRTKIIQKEHSKKKIKSVSKSAQ
jgi:hypothetical protein